MASNSGLSWSYEDRVELVRMNEAMYSLSSMAKKLGRSEWAVECHIKQLVTSNIYNNYIISQPQETNTMSQSNNNLVTIQTFIGERPAHTMSDADILDTIQREEAYVARLESFSCTSLAISKLITKHAQNIDALVALIDVRAEEES